jgi:hypothetical protein
VWLGVVPLAIPCWDSKINGSTIVQSCHLDFRKDYQKY